MFIKSNLQYKCGNREEVASGNYNKLFVQF